MRKGDKMSNTVDFHKELEIKKINEILRNCPYGFCYALRNRLKDIPVFSDEVEERISLSIFKENGITE
jgi:hypothetical protein